MSKIDLRLGDCLEVMKTIPDESVDLIITSPPYNLGKVHHTGNYKFTSYKNYIDDMPEEEYQQWQIAVLNECFRVLKRNGSMFYNHKNRIREGLQISPYSWLFLSKFLIKQELVWFNRSQNFDKVRFYPMTERIYWLVKDKTTKLQNIINHHDLFTSKDWKPEGTKGEFKRAFPLQMPLDIIQCFPLSQVVLDPFMGKGTVGNACKILNKDFIGIDVDETAFEIAKERIEKEEEE